MTNETQLSGADPKAAPYGARLQSAREALGLERKDAASQLRLNEKFIVMMEKDRYPADLPTTFVRGYLRSYSKFLQIPDFELKRALENIKPRPSAERSFAPQLLPPVTSGNYFMQFFTYLIILTLAGLVGTWWYNHSTHTPVTPLSENPPALPAVESINTPPHSEVSEPAPAANAQEAPSTAPSASLSQAAQNAPAVASVYEDGLTNDPNNITANTE